jgi:protein-S-isoprenylcysteine O-methyltransferase Ste14
MTAPRDERVKTICIAAALHGIFTISVPWLLLEATGDRRWASVPLGPVRGIGLLGIVFGIYLYLWALRRLLSRQTSALPGTRPTALETAGWYARVRHPLLLGVVLILLGEAVAAQSLVLLSYALLYWLWLNLFVARREEPDLRAAFGETYLEYCRRVPRWIPRRSSAPRRDRR